MFRRLPAAKAAAQPFTHDLAPRRGSAGSPPAAPPAEVDHLGHDFGRVGVYSPVVQRVRLDAERQGPFTRQPAEDEPAFRARMAGGMTALRDTMKRKDEDPEVHGEAGDLHEVPENFLARGGGERAEELAGVRGPKTVSGRGVHAALEAHVAERAKTAKVINENAKMPTLKMPGLAPFLTTRNKMRNDLAELQKKQADASEEEQGPLAAQIESKQKLLGNLDAGIVAKQQALATRNAQGHVPFWSHAPGESPVSDVKRLHMDAASGTYALQQGHGPMTQPDQRAKYAVVAPFSNPTDVRAGDSHDQLASDQEATHRPVSYAGSAFFNGDGTLRKWNNDTGHYKTHPGFAHQAGPSLPLDKFQPLHVDALRKRNLTEKLKKGGSVEHLAQELGVERKEEVERVMNELGVDPGVAHL